MFVSAHTGEDASLPDLLSRGARRPRALLLLLLAAQSACGAGWRRIEPAVPSSLPVRQQIEVWQQGKAVRLHAVSVTAEQVTGVPYIRPPDCDSCRVTIPASTVDSIRAGNPTAGFWKTVGLTLGGLLVAALVICGSSNSCQLEAD